MMSAFAASESKRRAFAPALARRVGLFIAVLAAGLYGQGCFHILHYLTVNADGTLDVQWRITAAAQILQAQKKQATSGEKSPGGDNPAAEIGKKAFDDPAGLRAGLAKVVNNVVVRDSQTQFDDIRHISFRTRKKTDKGAGKVSPLVNKLTGGLPLIPEYDPVKKRLAFYFPWGDEAHREKRDARKTDTKNPNKKGPEKKPAADPQGKKIAAMMLSTGRYQIVIAGAKVKNAYLLTTRGGLRSPVTALPMGNVTLINFPFLAAMQKYDDNGFRLVIELKH